MGTVTVIASGKGGTGKTTLTAALAAALARRGRSVALVDADLGLRSLDAVLGLQNHVVYDLVDVAMGLCSVEESLIRDTLHPGVMLLPASRGYQRNVLDSRMMMTICAALRSSFDDVLVDAPAGIGEGLHRAICGADRAILVTLPEVTAVRGAAETMRRLRQWELPVWLVLNRYRPWDALLGHCMDMGAVSALLPLPRLTVIPEDRAVGKALGVCRPASEGPSRAARAFRQAAKKLCEEPREQEAWEARESSRLRAGKKDMLWEEGEREA